MAKKRKAYLRTANGSNYEIVNTRFNRGGHNNYIVKAPYSGDYLVVRRWDPKSHTWAQSQYLGGSSDSLRLAKVALYGKPRR